MSNDPDDEKNRDIFHTAIGKVNPLKSDKVNLTRSPPSPNQVKINSNKITVDEAQLTDPAENELIVFNNDEPILFSRPGLQKKVIRKLKRGGFMPEANLDLHGATIKEAEPLLLSFITECTARGLHCVRIIHGKGFRSSNQQPVLKKNVTTWLQQLHVVLAFCSALAKDGGSGAVYVLLKKTN